MLINGRQERDSTCLTAYQMTGEIYCKGIGKFSKRRCCFTDYCNSEPLHITGTASGGAGLSFASIVLFTKSTLKRLTCKDMLDKESSQYKYISTRTIFSYVYSLYTSYMLYLSICVYICLFSDSLICTVH